MKLSDQESLGFLSLMALFKNYVLVYLLSNLMPETRTRSSDVLSEFLYALYEFVTPILIPIPLCLFSNYFLFNWHKSTSKNYKIALDPKFDDIALYMVTPLISFLLAEAVSTSGLLALSICGIFQSLISIRNMEAYKSQMILNTFTYLSFLVRQIGCILIGIITPFYLVNSPYQWYKLVIFNLVNIGV